MERRGNKQSILQFQDKLFEDGIKVGFYGYEIYYEKSNNLCDLLYEGELDSYETSEDGGLIFRGLYNGKMGYAYTEKLEEDSIAFLLDAAKKMQSIEEDDGTIFLKVVATMQNIPFTTKNLKLLEYLKRLSYFAR